MDTSTSLKRWAASLTTAVALVAAGAVLLGFVLHRASVDERRARFGNFNVGRVVEVVDDGVVVAYERSGSDFVAAAYPVNPQDYRPGDFVKIRALPDEPEHVVLEDAEQATTSHLPGLMAGGLLMAAGLALWLLRVRPSRAEGKVPAVTWVGRRHSA